MENLISASLPNPQKADLAVLAVLKHSLQNTHQEQTAAAMLICNSLAFSHARNMEKFSVIP